MNMNGRLKWVFLPSLGLVLAVFAVYYTALGYGFVFDDKAQILGNRWITSFASIPEVFATHSFGFMDDKYQAMTYRPFFFVLYMAEYALFGFAPWGWHLVNILLHSGNSVLVFLVLRHILTVERPQASTALQAFAAALVFALHPANAEPVSWLAAIGELSFTFMCLASLFLEVRAIDLRRRGLVESVLSRVVPAVFFLAALLVKETAVVFPIMVFTYDITRKGVRGLFSFERVLRYLPYAAVMAIYLLMRAWALHGSMTPTARLHPFLSSYEFALNSIVLLARYFKSLVLHVGEPPLQLLDPVFSIAEPRAFVSVIAVVAVPIALAFILRRITRLWPLILIVIFFPILPTLYSPAVSRFPFADRYLYFPSIGLAMLAAVTIGWLLSERRRLGVWALALILALSIPAALAARHRSAAWADELTLWGTALKAQPGNYAAIHAIAAENLRDGRAAEAVILFERALEMDLASPHPDESMALLIRRFLPRASMLAGMDEKAARYFTEYLSFMPNDAPLLYDFGRLKQENGMCADALENFERAAVFARNPRLLGMIYRGLGDCRYALGMRDEALVSYREALRFMPGDRELLGRIGYLEGAG